MDMQSEAASALNAPRPPALAAPSPQPGAPPQGGGDSLAAFAQAFARCEQTHQCSPQDRQILQAGLPKLVQMVQMTQKILQATQQGGVPAQPGAGAPPAQPGAQ